MEQKCPICKEEKLVESKSDKSWYICTQCGIRVMKEHVRDK